MEKKTVGKLAYSSAETAFATGFSVGTLANLRFQRRGPKYHKVGRKIVYFKEDLISWLQSKAVDHACISQKYVIVGSEKEKNHA